MKVIHLNLIENHINISILLKKLSGFGIDVKVLNNLNFCPHFICAKNPKNGEFFADNTNEGFYSRLMKTYEIVDCSDIDEFASQIGILKGNVILKENNNDSLSPNALF